MADFLGGLTGGATNFNAGGLSAAMGNIYPKVLFFLQVLLSMVVTFGIIITIYKFWYQYKIKITLSKRIGVGAVETVADRAKIITDSQNKMKLVLFKQRKGNKQAITLPIPEAKYKGKSGKSDHYNLWLDDNFECHPIEPPKVEDSFEKLIVRPQERAAWARMEDEILYKKYKNKDKLLQYAAPAILLTACITAFLIFFFASKELGGGMSEMASSFRQIASSCTKLG